MCTLRTIAELEAYPQFDCINTWRPGRFNDSIRDKAQIYKEYNAREDSLPVRDLIKFAFGDSPPLVR